MSSTSPSSAGPRVHSTSEALLSRLRDLLGERMSTGAAVRDHHSRGESHHDAVVPDAVVFPTSTADVQAIVAACAEHRCPMTPFGAGSSLEGHVIPVHGGISIDMTRMNRIVRLSVDDLDVTVEAGVTRKQLDRHLQSSGLMFPLDPGADATIGGMAATRASGTTAVRYGTMREAVLGLTVVTADGRAVRTGTRARKSSTGYDLTHLFVGAEGTLGIITEVTLRLHGRPEAVAAATCWFDSMESAVASVITIVQLGIPVARVELLDEVMMDATNRHSRLNRPVKPTLFFEFHGLSDANVDEQALAVGRDRRRSGWPRLRPRGVAGSPRGPVAGAPRRLLRGAGAAPGIARLDDGRLRPDFAAGGVHHGNAARCGRLEPDWAARRPRRRRQLPRDAAGESRAPGRHRRGAPRDRSSGGAGAGDGRDLLGRARRRSRQDAVPRGGAWLGGLDVMRTIKQALDPLNLMNPGKILPETAEGRDRGSGIGDRDRIGDRGSGIRDRAERRGR
jgi:D-lactate dehydrogenase (cytochrome)